VKYHRCEIGPIWFDFVICSSNHAYFRQAQDSNLRIVLQNQQAELLCRVFALTNCPVPYLTGFESRMDLIRALITGKGEAAHEKRNKRHRRFCQR
jgi:hypothetical protein